MSKYRKQYLPIHRGQNKTMIRDNKKDGAKCPVKVVSEMCAAIYPISASRVLAKASMHLSRPAVEWQAEICTRMRALPC